MGFTGKLFGGFSSVVWLGPLAASGVWIKQNNFSFKTSEYSYTNK
jgi:hypothetical protein